MTARLSNKPYIADIYFRDGKQSQEIHYHDWAFAGQYLMFKIDPAQVEGQCLFFHHDTIAYWSVQPATKTEGAA